MPPQSDPSHSPASQETDGPTPRHDARVLVSGGTKSEITLDGEVYTLRITKRGKLILTK